MHEQDSPLIHRRTTRDIDGTTVRRPRARAAAVSARHLPTHHLMRSDIADIDRPVRRPLIEPARPTMPTPIPRTAELARRSRRRRRRGSTIITTTRRRTRRTRARRASRRTAGTRGTVGSAAAAGSAGEERVCSGAALSVGVEGEGAVAVAVVLGDAGAVAVGVERGSGFAAVDPACACGLEVHGAAGPGGAVGAFWEKC